MSEADRGYPHSSHSLNAGVQLVAVPVLNSLNDPAAGKLHPSQLLTEHSSGLNAIMKMKLAASTQTNLSIA